MSRQPAWLKVALGAGVGFLCGVLVIIVLAWTGADERPTRTVTAQSRSTAPAVARIAVPDVVGTPLDDARRQLEDVGFAVKRTGGGLFGVVVESNWAVRAQTPAAGTPLARGATVSVFVDRR